MGITPKLAERLLAAGADAITLGNHTWRRQEIAPYLATSDRVVRPANFAADAPGPRPHVVPAADGTPVARRQRDGLAVAEPARSMWELVDELVDEARAATPVVLVDVHAEATSEKVALARWLDGRVTAVIGTHTHVQTADARVQPGGTAAITDAGMTGPHDSVIGVKADLATHRMRTGMPVRFEVATAVSGSRESSSRATRQRPGDRDHAGSGALALEAASPTGRGRRAPRRRRRAAMSRTSTSHDAVGSNSFTSSQ